MNKIIALAAFAMSSFALQSYAAGTPANNRKIENNEPFQKIVIADNLNVMLVDEDASTIIVEGSAALLDEIKLSVTKGTLSIKSTNKNTASKAIVYVPVKYLSSIEIMNNSAVYSPDIIQSDDLKVLVTGDCKIGLQTTGKVTIQHSEDYDFSFMRVKNPKLFKTEHL